MKIEADLNKCEGLGMCEAMLHDVFEVGDDGFVNLLDGAPEEGRRKEVLAAVDSCPVMALKLVG
jgi:ferredoxin